MACCPGLGLHAAQGHERIVGGRAAVQIEAQYLTACLVGGLRALWLHTIADGQKQMCSLRVECDDAARLATATCWCLPPDYTAVCQACTIVRNGQCGTGQHEAAAATAGFDIGEVDARIGLETRGNRDVQQAV